jgi:hypothetical protein
MFDVILIGFKAQSVGEYMLEGDKKALFKTGTDKISYLTILSFRSLSFAMLCK